MTVSKLPSEQARAGTPRPAQQGKWGFQLQDITPQMADKRGLKANHGALVVGVQPGSPAAEAGMRAGDIILEVNRQPVESVKDTREPFAKAAEKDSLLLLVQRGEGNLFVVLEKQA